MELERIVRMVMYNFKKMLCIGVVIHILSYIYCMPIETEELFMYILKIIITSLVFLLMIHGAKLNNKTGATRFFSKIKYAKYSEFGVVFLLLLAAVLGVLVMLKTKQFDNSCLIVPSIIGLYSASKASCIYESELQKKEE